MNPLKKYISLLLALFVLISVLPISAVATENSDSQSSIENATEETKAITEDTDSTEVAEAPTEAEESTDEKLARLQREMDAILVRYLGAVNMTDEEVFEIINTMPWDTMEAALADRDALALEITALTADEIAQLEATYPGTHTIAYFYDTIELAMTPSIFAATGTHTPVTGVTVSVSGATDNSMSSGAVTVTAKGSAGVFGFGASAKTATITVYNDSDSAATVGFTWTATSVNQLTIDGTVYSGSSGTFSKMLASKASFVVKITTAKNGTTNKLVMSNFSLTAAAASSNVKINYNSTYGSVTADGAAVSAGGTVENVSASTGTALVATAKSGSTFIAWVNEANNSVLSKSASYTLIPDKDMTVKAVFRDGNAWFFANNSQYLYDGLAAAAATAQSASNKTIVLAADGTLPAVTGGYNIPSGVTLLIPFDDAHTLYTTEPARLGKDGDGTSYSTPTAFRTLTMASGAKITVDGAISLSAKFYAADGGEQSGTPSGPVSFIKMNSDSNITINNGGSLYAWGYITGSGTITANNGATVYECFQFAGWRGGDVATGSGLKDKKIFPISQYYIQNIEVPITFYSGAKEFVCTSADITWFGPLHNTVNFIAEKNALFSLTDGYLTKWYDGTTDRLIVNVKGDITMSAITLESLQLGATVNSANYVLPLTSNLTVNIESGTVIANQNLSLIPGSELNISEGATFKMGTVNSNPASLHVYDSAQWGLFCTDVSNNYKYIPLRYAPGRKYDRTEADLKNAVILVDGTLDANGGCIYTTAGGANIYSTDAGQVMNTAGTETVCYQVSQVVKDLTYTNISITPAKLRNGDGSTYLQSGAGTYVYNKEHGRWVLDKHELDAGSITTAPGCKTDGVMTYTCNCGYSYDEPIKAEGVHVYENDKCTDCGLFKISYASMTMANSLDMNFAFRQDHAEDWTGYYAVIIRERLGTDGEGNYTVDDTVRQEIPVDTSVSKQYTINGVPHYFVTLTGIAGKEMTDPISVTIYNAEGKAVSFVWEDSVQAQAMRNLALDTATDLSKTMVVDMLNYGTAAQTNFGYRTDAPANKLLSDAQRGLATGDITITNSATVPAGYKANVYLVSNIQFMMAFKDINPDTAKAVVSFTDHYGDAQNDETTDFTDRGNGYYSITIDETVVADGRQDITCTVYDGEKVLYEVTDSMESYAARATASTSKDLYTMIMKFSDSARTYLKSKLQSA